MVYWKRWLGLMLLAGLILDIFTSTSVYAQQDLTTQYRVYQNDQLLKEFSSRNQAIAYAKYFANSYVEDIVTREWVFSSFPRYQVLVQGTPLTKVYDNYHDALQEATKHEEAIIKDLQKTGIVWNNYPDFQLYQGDRTFPEWSFETFEEAKKEAAKWENAHIMKLRTNQWVWDNLTEEQKNEYRNQEELYEVRIETSSDPVAKNSFLQDAIREALKYENSFIVNTKTNQVVYENSKPYVVKQSGRKIQSFYHLDMAIQYAKGFVRTSIEYDGMELWYNEPYYEVVAQDESLDKFNSVQDALAFALQQERAKIIDRSGKTIWDNSLQLAIWGWNGSSSTATIKKHVEQASGLDVDSPTWFTLKNANGDLEDTSDPELVEWLHERGIEVHPLVNNQFDGTLTSSFLASTSAQDQFIRTLIDRSAELGVDGINIDFESLKAKDRDAFTAFMKNLVDYAHQKQLKVSIDLPRGSILWNHQTAFDHAELAKFMDYIIIMAYDQYWSGSETPGSVSGLQWAEEGVQEFLSYGMERDQLILGIPFYIRQWQLDSNGELVGNRALYSSDVDEVLSSNEHTTTWDPKFNQYKIEYTKDGSTYVFWLEDQQSLEARLHLAKEYRLVGVAAWRLGQEPANFWNTVVQNKS